MPVAGFQHNVLQTLLHVVIDGPQQLFCNNSNAVHGSAAALSRVELSRVIEQLLCMHPQVVVSQHNDGAQVLEITTDLEAGRLLLHWGVEGGKNYQGGWRLPGESCRPEGSVQYKDRALQTPFRCVL
jgi:hypothetical protein